VPAGTQAVYYWYADKPGTFSWNCHVEASEHVTMGMYGALIVRPKKPNTVYGGNLNDQYDKEYVWLLSDVDSLGRDAIQTDFNPALLGIDPSSRRGQAIENYNFARFDADYWLINGRAFPDTIFGTSTPADDAACAADPARHADLALDFEGCNHRASGPPSGFLTGANNIASYAPLVAGNWDDRVLLRLINMGYQDQSLHFHGWHVTEVGKDANPIPNLAQRQQYTLQIGAGESHDVIIDMVKTANHENNGAGPNGVGGSLITGQGGGLNEFACVWGIYSAPEDCSGALGDNNTDVQWYPAHSSYLYQVTNNGLYPGGMMGILLAVP
jgi:FtsP/CotA-like multicopper oxidase with cupredoxin domain